MEQSEGRLHTDAQFAALQCSMTPSLRCSSSSPPPDFSVRAKARFTRLSGPKEALKPAEQFKINRRRNAAGHAHHQKLPQSSPANQGPLGGCQQKNQCKKGHCDACCKSQEEPSESLAPQNQI